MDRYPHHWTWLTGRGGTSGRRHRGCKHCGTPMPGDDTRYGVLRDQECPARLRVALDVAERPPEPDPVFAEVTLFGDGNSDKLRGIKAIRDAVDDPMARTSLRDSKAFIEEVMSGRPKTLRVVEKNVDALCETLGRNGFRTVVAHEEGPELSEHALRVLEALESKPELLAEIRAVLAAR